MRFLLLFALLGGCGDDTVVDHVDAGALADLSVFGDLSVDVDRPYSSLVWTVRQAECTELGGVCVTFLERMFECAQSPELLDLGVSLIYGPNVCDYIYAVPEAPMEYRESVCCRPYPWPCKAMGGTCAYGCAPGKSLDAGAGACPIVGWDTPAPCCAH